MGRNFDDYPGFQPFRSWANTYAQDCNRQCSAKILYVEKLTRKLQKLEKEIVFTYSYKYVVHMYYMINVLIGEKLY